MPDGILVEASRLPQIAQVSHWQQTLTIECLFSVVHIETVITTMPQFLPA